MNSANNCHLFLLIIKIAIQNLSIQFDRFLKHNSSFIFPSKGSTQKRKLTKKERGNPSDVTDQQIIFKISMIILLLPWSFTLTMDLLFSKYHMQLV